MSISDRIKEILNENQKFGGITGFGANSTEQTHSFRRHDAKRKRIERQGDKRLKEIKNKKSNTQDEDIDPRTQLTNEMRFTLKETFIVKLLEYVQTSKKTYLDDAVNLMKEYPKLYNWVTETSQKALPQQPFALYSMREWFTEEVGSECERIGKNYHVWTLSESALEHKTHQYDESMVLECRVSPDKALIYIPAFAKVMEELILSGKIMETIGNPVREALKRKECITSESVNKGLITKINKRKI